jgi:asparagine synthase (glutamine-hydrolysing)
MCGIASIVRFGADRVDPTDLRRMCSAIAHRGPDDAGFALLDRGAVGLGHVRLSIVDLAGGDQPIYNEDHSIAVICNGELYDYPRLRRDLARRGHLFRTRSDSELVVHLYEEYGTDLFHRLNGEFAFVLWDGRRRRLIAGRDPCGIKPLYYHARPGEVLLCSEVKGIYALDRVERKLSKRYLAGPALGIYVPDPCAFENVRSLRPGHYLVVEPGRVCREVEHYRQEFAVCEEMTFAEATAAIREKLTAAVQRRLAADVPVHAYLSGGLDSTIICGLLAEAGARPTCFNVGFPGSPYDESDKARQVAGHFGLPFETVPCTQELIAENIARAVYCCEMPLNNYNAVAKTILSGYVRSRGVKVCLTGEGSDELFAGFPFFKLEMLWQLEQAGGEQADRTRALWEKFRALEYRTEGLLWERGDAWKKMTRVFGYPSYFATRARQARRCIRAFYDVKGLGLTDEDMPESILKHSVDPARLAGLDPFNKSRLITFNQLYNAVIPTLGDRVEMVNSLECRPPFLDRELLELAGTIPPRYFIDLDRMREKHLLREACRDLLPPGFETEHKHTFMAPAWTSFARTRAGRPLFADLLSRATIRKVGVFRPWVVSLARRVLDWCPLPRGFARKIDAVLGTILTTHLLHEQFVEKRIACDARFPMADRSPQRLGEKRRAA